MIAHRQIRLALWESLSWIVCDNESALEVLPRSVFLGVKRFIQSGDKMERKLYNLSFLRQYVTYTLSSLFHAYEAGGWISGEKRNKVRRAHGLERGYGNASI